MRKDDLNVHVFHDPSIGRILSEKRYGGTGLLSQKNGSFTCRT